MAAVGAVLGLERIVQAFLLTAIAGGVLAAGLAIANRRLAATVRRTEGGDRTGRAPTGDRSAGAEPLAHGPAIAAGSMLAAWLW